MELAFQPRPSNPKDPRAFSIVPPHLHIQGDGIHSHDSGEVCLSIFMLWTSFCFHPSMLSSSSSHIYETLPVFQAPGYMLGLQRKAQIPSWGSRGGNHDVNASSCRVSDKWSLREGSKGGSLASLVSSQAFFKLTCPLPLCPWQ